MEFSIQNETSTVVFASVFPGTTRPMSTRERVILIHYYRNAVVGTTQRYPDEVTDPSYFAELKDLPEAGEEELSMMTKMKGEIAQVKEEKPKKPAAKSMMEVLRETAESLK